jgi:hypothetical protein
MILIIDAPGQLCNQLWTYAPVAAFSIKYKIPLRIMGFHDYASLLELPHETEHVKFAELGPIGRSFGPKKNTPKESAILYRKSGDLLTSWWVSICADGIMPRGTGGAVFF